MAGAVRWGRSPALALLWIWLWPGGGAVADARGTDLPASDPESEGFDSQKLIELAEWVRDSKLPIYSVLISRNGKLVFELYTGRIQRDDAHYLMSVTKSIQS